MTWNVVLAVQRSAAASTDRDTSRSRAWWRSLWPRPDTHSSQPDETLSHHALRRTVRGRQCPAPIPGAVHYVSQVLFDKSRNIVPTCAKLAHVAAYEMLPRVGERVTRRPRCSPARRRPGCSLVHRRQSRIHDVDEHERGVARKVNEDVVRGVIGPWLSQLDAFAPDIQRAPALKGFLRRRACGIVVPQRHLRVSACPMRMTLVPNSDEAPT